MTHRIRDISFSRGVIRCTCAATVTSDGQALGLVDGDAALEAAWLQHRRDMGLRSYVGVGRVRTLRLPARLHPLM